MGTRPQQARHRSYSPTRKNVNMWATRRLLQHRQPMIRFLGKRSTPKGTLEFQCPQKCELRRSLAAEVDHSPHAHPEAPDHKLPDSFAQYRNRAIQHGPLGGQQAQQQPAQSQSPSQAKNPAYSTSSAAMQPYGAIGGHSGKQLGSVQPAPGEAWDRDELPARFRRRPWSEAEIEAVDTAGASMW